MIDPTGPSPLRADPHAMWRLDQTCNEMNGANEGTRNLPDSLVVSQRGAVTLVRLSRPAKRNALNIAMMSGIETICGSPPEGTRAIVLHGEGDHFCAGADLALVAEIRRRGAPSLLADCASGFRPRSSMGLCRLSRTCKVQSSVVVWKSPQRRISGLPNGAPFTRCRRACAEFSWAAAAPCVFRG